MHNSVEVKPGELHAPAASAAANMATVAARTHTVGPVARANAARHQRQLQRSQLQRRRVVVVP